MFVLIAFKDGRETALDDEAVAGFRQSTAILTKTHGLNKKPTGAELRNLRTVR